MLPPAFTLFTLTSPYVINQSENIHLSKSEPILSRQTARLVLMFRHEAIEWKIAHSSISIPYGLARENEIYPMTNLEEHQHELTLIIELRTKELAEANRKLEALSNTDGLTNIGNRRLFDNSLHQAWERCIQTEMPICAHHARHRSFQAVQRPLWPRCR